jgi:branched-chain amino acid transport system substrate-binding protein
VSHSKREYSAVRPRRSRFFAAAVSSLVVVTALAGCSSGGTADGAGEEANPKEIVIAMPAALTGPGATYGTAEANAAQMTVDAINKAGGIKELGGAKLVLKVADTKSETAQMSQVVRQLAAEKPAAFATASLSGDTVPAKALFESLKIPTFTNSGDPALTANNDGGILFRVGPPTSLSVQTATAYVKALTEEGTLEGVKKVGLLTVSITPGPLIAENYTKAFEALGFEVVPIAYDPAQVKDFAPTVAKLEADDVDLIAGFQYAGDAALFAQAMENQSWRPEHGFFWADSAHSSDAFRAAYAENLAAGWLTITNCPLIDSDYFPDEAREIANKFREKYDIGIEASTGCIGASEIAIIANAIAKAKSADPAKIAEAARSLDITDPMDSAYPYYMMGGGVKYTTNQENGSLVVPYVQLTKDGEFDVVYPEEMATAELQPLS